MLVSLFCPFFAGCGTLDFSVEVGSPFPEFNLKSHKGNSVGNEELLGSKCLVWFFPKASTPGWTRQGCGFRDEFAKYEEKGIRIYGVSFDAPETNAKFAEKHDFPFLLLSDTDRRLAIALGLVKGPGAWMAPRVTFVISPDGRVEKIVQTKEPGGQANSLLGDLWYLGSAQRKFPERKVKSRLGLCWE